MGRTTRTSHRIACGMLAGLAVLAGGCSQGMMDDTAPDSSPSLDPETSAGTTEQTQTPSADSASPPGTTTSETTIGEEASATDPTDATTTAGSAESSTGPDEIISDCDVPSDLFACEDFEQGGFDQTLWEPVTVESTLTIDDTFSAHGGSSLHLHLTDMNGDQLQTGTEAYLRSVPGQIVPTAGNTVFGRFYFYLEPEVPSRHAWLVRADEDNTVQYRLDHRGRHWEARAQNAGEGNWSKGPNVDQPHPALLATWQCVEFEFNGQEDAIRVWLDGEPAEDLEFGPGELSFSPEFTRIQIGYHIYNDPDEILSYDLWYDDLALGPERIGCLED